MQKGCYVCISKAKLPYHVRFLIDEFANIGQIPDFTKKLATMRKYEISATVILQSLSQIKTLYKDDWEDLVGNCDSFLFLGAMSQDTLKSVSEMMGKMTQRVRSSSASRGGKSSVSNSYSEKGRDIMTPDELRRMPNEKCIYMMRGEQPYYDLKHTFLSHPNYKYTSEGKEGSIYRLRIEKPQKFQKSQLIEAEISSSRKKLNAMSPEEREKNNKKAKPKTDENKIFSTSSSKARSHLQAALNVMYNENKNPEGGKVVEEHKGQVSITNYVENTRKYAREPIVEDFMDQYMESVAPATYATSATADSSRMNFNAS